MKIIVIFLQFHFLKGPAIQVRRQDKKHEAKFVKLETYVEHLEEYFDILDTKRGIEQRPKSVYVATGMKIKNLKK